MYFCTLSNSCDVGLNVLLLNLFFFFFFVVVCFFNSLDLRKRPLNIFSGFTGVITPCGMLG